MADFVVDTNVWVMVDKPIGEISLKEVECMAACKKWLTDFANRHEDRLVLDNCYKILRKYRNNIREDGLARRLLNKLEEQPRDRLIELDIVFNDEGLAVVPSTLEDFDKDDRKFVAVALAHNPHPPIINATDTDWTKAQEQIKALGITVCECCPDYIAEKLKGKRKELQE